VEFIISRVAAGFAVVEMIDAVKKKAAELAKQFWQEGLQAF
jgi:hypothetical protein